MAGFRITNYCNTALVMVSIVNFEHICRLVLVFLLLTLTK